MSFGLETYSTSGDLMFDEVTALGRLVYTRPLAMGTSGSYTIPASIQGKNIAAFAISNTGYQPPIISKTSTTVSWQSFDLTSYTSFWKSGDAVLFVYVFN